MFFEPVFRPGKQFGTNTLSLRRWVDSNDTHPSKLTALHGASQDKSDRFIIMGSDTSFDGLTGRWNTIVGKKSFIDGVI
jgi:hypothetical protein